MSRPVVCYYHCRRCDNYFERLARSTRVVQNIPHLQLGLSRLQKKDVWPYQREFHGSDTYPLPDAEV